MNQYPSWFKIVIDEAMAASELNILLIHHFGRVHAENGTTIDFAMFQEADENGFGETIYLPPSALLYCPDLLKKFGAVETAMPDGDRVRLYAGRSDSRDYFFEGTNQK